MFQLRRSLNRRPRLILIVCRRSESRGVWVATSIADTKQIVAVETVSSRASQ
jgi:hypothetical protein